MQSVDTVVADPPYGERTHRGHDAGAEQRRGILSADFRDMNYVHWSASDVSEFMKRWNVAGWIFALTSHDLIMAYEDAAIELGRYPFAPVTWIAKRPRLIGDGPANWSCYGMASRIRSVEFSRWGCLDGAYIIPQERGGVIGGKPLALARAIVRDYSRPGDLICDPCAGGATTLLAAVLENRRAIGAELDPSTFELAVKRLRAGYTPAFDFGE